MIIDNYRKERMVDRLLSIVIPTKNRYEYLTSFVELIASYKQSNVELVIQDNSDDNVCFEEYLAEKKYEFVVYNYCAEPLSIIENSDRAVKASSGKYVCFMGDDDLVLKDLYTFVVYMDMYGIESAFFNRAKYSWPGVNYSVHNIPNVVMPRFKGCIKELDVDKQLQKLLKKGATTLEYTPQLYHGVILRECLNVIYRKTGTYFPGPSPDMAVSVALSKTVKKHIFCDVPYIIAGTAPKSAGGMGAGHKHKGEIKKVSWLPHDTEDNWEERVPKVWTGGTIYAESAIKALRQMNANAELKLFNYHYNYANTLVFNYEYKRLVDELLAGNTLKRIRTYLYAMVIFITRLHMFIKNKLTYQYRITSSILRDDITDSFQAGVFMNSIVTEKALQLDMLFKKIYCSKYGKGEFSGE